LDYTNQTRNVDVSTSYEEYLYIRPTTPLETKGSISIDIPDQEVFFLDLQKSQMCVRLKVVAENGTSLDTTTNYFSANNFLYTLFRNIVIYFNERIVYSSEDHYGYRCMIENLTSKEESDLNVGFYAEKEDGEPNRTETQARKTEVAASTFLELQGPLLSDINTISRLIPNKVSVRITLDQQDPKFVMLCSDATPAGCKIVIDDLYLKVLRVAINPQIQRSISSALDSSDSAFHMTRTVIKTAVIQPNTNSLSIERIFSGQIPKVVLLGLVSSEAYKGDLAKNPYNFKTAEVSKIVVSADDVPAPANYMTFDFASKRYLDGYLRLRDLVKLEHELVLNRDNFVKGKALFGFELVTKLDPNSDPLARSGNVKLEMSLKTAPTSALVVIIYGLFDTCLWMNKNREFYYK
jgi:hypothetical protein